MDFGEFVRKLREERDLSQEALAKLVGKSKSTISKIENNLRTPDLPLIKNLAQAFGVPVSVLYCGNNSESLTLHEREVLNAYRGLPEEIKKHIDFLLGIEKNSGESSSRVG